MLCIVGDERVPLEMTARSDVAMDASRRRRGHMKGDLKNPCPAPENVQQAWTVAIRATACFACSNSYYTCSHSDGKQVWISS